MERRVFRRIPVNLFVRFYHASMAYTGIVSNLSIKGMCIETRKDFPLQSTLEILVLLRGESLKVPVTVASSRVIENGHMFYGLGTELIEQPQNYIQFVDSAQSPLTGRRDSWVSLREK